MGTGVLAAQLAHYTRRLRIELEPLLLLFPCTLSSIATNEWTDGRTSAAHLRVQHMCVECESKAIGWTRQRGEAGGWIPGGPEELVKKYSKFGRGRTVGGAGIQVVRHREWPIVLLGSAKLPQSTRISHQIPSS